MGGFFFYLDSNGQYQDSLKVVPLDGHSGPRLLLKAPFYDSDGRFSPDGRWIAYTSRQQETVYVFVVPFPGPGAAKQISLTGGTVSPMWRRDGKAIFYLDDNNNLMETEVAASANIVTIGKTQKLFKTKADTLPFQGSPYVVSRDGKRFMINTQAEENRAEITVITNWMAGLGK